MKTSQHTRLAGLCRLITALAVLAGATALGACGKLDQLSAHYTGHPAHVCVSGVTYLQFTNGATVMVDRAGKPVPCTE